MTRSPAPRLDERDAPGIVRDLLARLPAYVPGWAPVEGGPASAVIQAFARYLQALVERVNQAPNRNQMAFLEMLGINLLPPQAARAPLVFTARQGLGDGSIPAGTRAGAAVPGRQDHLIFETENEIALAAAGLVEVVALWPGRDAYADHSAEAAAGRPFQLFTGLHDTPHALYLAHDVNLALGGSGTIEVKFELARPGSHPIDLAWEYWDGEAWREFNPFRGRKEAWDTDSLDGTEGLTRSGAVRLVADCAKSVQRKVNDVAAHWLRARAREALPRDPGRVWPLVDRILIRSILAAPIGVFALGNWEESTGDKGMVYVPNTNLKVAGTARLVGPDIDDVRPFDLKPTEAIWSGLGPGRYRLRLEAPGFEPFEHSFDLKPDRGYRPMIATSYEKGVAVEGAYADGQRLDLTKAFYPFGQTGAPGNAFYLKSAEAFGRPGARFFLRAEVIGSQYGTLTEAEAGAIEITTEQWNGDRWQVVGTKAQASGVFTKGASVLEGDVPLDVKPTRVNNDEGYWLRARISAGSFTRTQVVQVTAGDKMTIHTPLPQAMENLLLGYEYRSPFDPPQICLSHNDFRWTDRTVDVSGQGRSFEPFAPPEDATPALYLGFDGPLPAGLISLYLDVQETPGEIAGVPLRWEYWDGSDWLALGVHDDTRDLALPGMVAALWPGASPLLPRFGQPRTWLRVRLQEDGEPRQTRMNGIYANAVWAAQVETWNDETLGAGTGEPGQVQFTRQTPVLSGQTLEVRELEGLRAPIELPLLIQDLERSGMTEADVRTVRDRRTGRIGQAWVRWQERPNLFFSGPGDRHYTIERVRGRVIFGDGRHGSVPPVGAGNVLARSYRSGGGLDGNVPAGAVKQLLSAVTAQAVANPRPAEGGSDGETAEGVLERGPQVLRHRRQALALSDYEALAREASPAVAVARALPATHPTGRPAPGWVRVIIMPHSQDPRPQPSFELRERVRAFLAARMPAGIAGQVSVYGPDYLAVGVSVAIVPSEPGRGSAVLAAVRLALQGFLHPLSGGPEGVGWPFGRAVYISDVAALLDAIPGLDYAAELELMLDGTSHGDTVTVPGDRIVVAGPLRLTLATGGS